MPSGAGTLGGCLTVTEDDVAKPLLDDELWAAVEPLLLGHRPRPKGGKPPVEDRVCRRGILFVLKSAIAWEDVPYPLRDGLLRHDPVDSADEWRRASVWAALHRLLLDELRGEDAIDSSSARAVHRGKKRGRGPVDRAKAGSTYHLAVDAAGSPLAAEVTAANVNGVTRLIPLVDAIPLVRGKRGAPLAEPNEVMGDCGYHDDDRRMTLSGRGIATAIARRGDPQGSGFGVLRYVVEQTVALLHQFRRLRTRFDERADVHETLLTIGCAMICWRRLHRLTG